MPRQYKVNGYDILTLIIHDLDTTDPYCMMLIYLYARTHKGLNVQNSDLERITGFKSDILSGAINKLEETAKLTFNIQEIAETVHTTDKTFKSACIDDDLKMLKSPDKFIEYGTNSMLGVCYKYDMYRKAPQTYHPDIIGFVLAQFINADKLPLNHIFELLEGEDNDTSKYIQLFVMKVLSVFNRIDRDVYLDDEMIPSLTNGEKTAKDIINKSNDSSDHVDDTAPEEVPVHKNRNKNWKTNPKEFEEVYYPFLVSGEYTVEQLAKEIGLNPKTVAIYKRKLDKKNGTFVDHRPQKAIETAKKKAKKQKQVAKEVKKTLIKSSDEKKEPEPVDQKPSKTNDYHRQLTQIHATLPEDPMTIAQRQQLEDMKNLKTDPYTTPTGKRVYINSTYDNRLKKNRPIDHSPLTGDMLELPQRYINKGRQSGFYSCNDGQMYYIHEDKFYVNKINE